MGREGGVMSMDLYRKIVDEAATIPLIDQVVLHGLGEPVLDRHLEERIEYARQVRPGWSIEIYTNGVYLDPARFESLKAAGLTSVVFSVNAVRSEQHEAVMGLVGKYVTVCENATYAIANRGEVGVEIHAVSNDDQFTEADRIEFYSLWGSAYHGGHGVCVREMNWAGLNRTMVEIKSNECCARAIGQIYVMYDGRVTMCCLDPSGQTVFGDLNKQTIKEVYNSDYYSMFRGLHSADKAAVFKQCKTCTRA
jgi:radical SAM protein with 4Fe4S-binding SPASM domain